MRTALLACLAALVPVGPARAVLLGTEEVPRERFVVYLTIGHSNMEGRASPPDTEPHPRGWKFDFRERKWVQAVPPIAASGRGNRMGPGMPTIKALAAAYPEYHIGILSVAKSAASVEKNFLRGRQQYDQLIEAAKEVAPHVTFGGMLVMLGRLEARDEARAREMLTLATTCIKQVRQDLNLPDLPVLWSRIEMDAPKKPAHQDLADAMIHRIPETVPRTAVIESIGPYCDTHHFTVEGYVRWAANVVQIIRQKEWFPLATPFTLDWMDLKANQTFPLGRPVQLKASVKTRGGRIKSVEFFDGETKLGEKAVHPFVFAWPAPKPGIHKVRFKVTDVDQNEGESDELAIGVGSVPKALLVCQSAAIGQGEAIVKNRLEHLGYLVSAIDDDAIDPDYASLHKVAVVSDSVHQLGLVQVRQLPMPVVSWHPSWSELYLASAETEPVEADRLQIAAPNHAAAAGLSDTVPVAKAPTTLHVGAAEEGTVAIAALADDPTKAAVVGIEGDTVLPAKRDEGAKAPSRRVALGLESAAFENLTLEGWRLFDASVAWAAGGKRAAPQVTSAGATPPRHHVPAVLELDDWPGKLNGLVFLWQNVSARNRVLDRRRGSRVCLAEPRGLATFGRNFDMDLAGGTFEADIETVDRLVDACRMGRAVAIECVITPTELRPARPGIIAMIGTSATSHNLMLVQAGEWVMAAVRTHLTGTGSTPVRLVRLTDRRPRHLIFAYRGGEGDAPGRLACYVDGEPVTVSGEVRGNLLTWPPMPLYFGGAPGGGGEWAGTVEGVAVYTRFIPPAEAAHKYRLYADRLTDRMRPDRTVVEARLLAKSLAPEPPTVYRRAFVVNLYEVTDVLTGDCPRGKVLVGQWAALDGVSLPRVTRRRPGESYTLILEPMDAHAELETEEQYNDTGEFALPMFYDVER